MMDPTRGAGASFNVCRQRALVGINRASFVPDSNQKCDQSAECDANTTRCDYTDPICAGCMRADSVSCRDICNFEVVVPGYI